jgi:hypothetical protein
MEQDARAVADLLEVPVPGGVAGDEGVLAREAASSGAGNAGGHGAAGPESDEEEDTEVICSGASPATVLNSEMHRS